MEAVSDLWGEKPLDLVKKKIPVAVVTPSPMIFDNLRKPDEGTQGDYHECNSESDDTKSEFFTAVKLDVEDVKLQKKIAQDEGRSRLCYKGRTSPREEDSGVGTPSPLAVSEQGPTDYSLLEVKRECSKSPRLSNERRRDPDTNYGANVLKEQGFDVQGEILKGMREDMSRFAMQSPNLYSALKGKDGGLQDPTVLSQDGKCSETPKRESSGIPAAYLEVFDKLMADYVKKMSGQNATEQLKTEGLYSMIHRLAACEQKFWSALYMGSLLNSSVPGLSTTLPTVNHIPQPSVSPVLPSQHPQQLPSSFSPGVSQGLPMRLPAGLPSGLHSGLLPGLGAGLMGYHQSSSLLNAAYQNLLLPETYRNPPSIPTASAASPTSSTTTNSNSSPILSSRLQDSQSRLKELIHWRASERQLSTPSSGHNSFTSATDLSSSSIKSGEESMSASSSVRSSSVSSPLNLALSPMSSMGASPPLSSKSDSHFRTKPSKRSVMDHQKNSSNSDGSKGQDSGNGNNQDKKKPHIKKPLNAFMLYMKEMRAKVVAECTLKESAAINQILGRRWHSLTREEQAKYYEKARHERQLHMQLYPAWSARDNYGYGAKKKKRKKERVPVDTGGGNSMKKCRARYGLDQQSQWCKPCRRKKKCIRYHEAGGGGGGGDDGNQSDDNLGSCGSVGEGDAHTPVDEDDGDEAMSHSHSMSSPGGLSGLSSLTSPSMILPSPSTSLASPSVSLASPCMSLQSPLTPLEYECKPPPPPLPLPLPLPMYNHQHSPLLGPPLHRHPVGTNPHDINNPLSVNQLTGKCIKTETNSTASSGSGGAMPGPSAASAPPAPPNIIRVT